MLNVPKLHQGSPLPSRSTGSDPACEITAWLDAFAEAVRSENYEAGKRLFAPEVVGFGTVGVMLRGLETLIDGQWKRVWGVTSGFRFYMARMTFGIDGDLAWAAVPWSSMGHMRNGQTYQRHGRATYVLRRLDGKWLAVHSHHSIDPSGESPDSGPH